MRTAKETFEADLHIYLDAKYVETKNLAYRGSAELRQIELSDLVRFAMVAEGNKKLLVRIAREMQVQTALFEVLRALVDKVSTVSRDDR